MTNRTHRRPSLENSKQPRDYFDLGTLRQRTDNWADHVDEPAVLTSHGCLLTVVGARVAPGPASPGHLEEA